MNIRDFVSKAILIYPDNEAVIFQDTRLTTRQLVERMYRLGNALLDLGLQKGDRVGVLLNNCHQSVEATYGVMCAGLVYVPLNSRNSALEHLYALDNSGAKAVIMGDEFVDVIASILPKTETVAHAISVHGKISGSMHDYEKLMAKASAAEPSIEILPEDVACIRFTGGTTGKPKGATHTHRGDVMKIFNRITNTGYVIEESDAIGLTGPVTHASGQMILPYLIRGAKVVILPGFDLKMLLPLIEKERITALYMVPTMIIRMLVDPDLKKYDLSSLKIIRYGASPIPPDVLKRAVEALGNIFIQGYGLAEGGAPLTVLTKDDHILDGTEKALKRITSVGRETLTARIKIMDEDGKFLPPNEVGEIVVQSEQNMREYWNNPEASAQTLQGGWLHTRDIGYMDEEGYIYLVDRKGDMIISGGFNIYPKEIENVLYEHPAVLEAAVFGVPDDEWGESVRAVVTLKPNMSATEEELIDHCRKQVAGYKKPKKIDFIAEMPKSFAGKILKRELKAPFWKGRTRMVS
jgi:acyl-CoA synthetase (AMP-forming)/AMP-acid ligase II